MAIKKASQKGYKTNFVRYADDFIVTAASKEILETVVRPVIIAFLKERDLELSNEKTLIFSDSIYGNLDLLLEHQNSRMGQLLPLLCRKRNVYLCGPLHFPGHMEVGKKASSEKVQILDSKKVLYSIGSCELVLPFGS